MDATDLTSSEYPHGDFKADLELGLFKRAQSERQGEGERLRPSTRSSYESVATGVLMSSVIACLNRCVDMV
jgi:hypothetical protein